MNQCIRIPRGTLRLLLWLLFPSSVSLVWWKNKKKKSTLITEFASTHCSFSFKFIERHVFTTTTKNFSVKFF